MYANLLVEIEKNIDGMKELCFPASSYYDPQYGKNALISRKQKQKYFI